MRLLLDTHIPDLEPASALPVGGRGRGSARIAGHRAVAVAHLGMGARPAGRQGQDRAGRRSPSLGGRSDAGGADEGGPAHPRGGQASRFHRDPAPGPGRPVPRRDRRRPRPPARDLGRAPARRPRLSHTGQSISGRSAPRARHGNVQPARFPFGCGLATAVHGSGWTFLQGIFCQKYHCQNIPCHLPCPPFRTPAGGGSSEERHRTGGRRRRSLREGS